MSYAAAAVAEAMGRSIWPTSDATRDASRALLLVSSQATTSQLEDRGLAFFDDVFGAAHGGRRVGRDHLANDQIVEQLPDGGQVLLDGGGAVGGLASSIYEATANGEIWPSSSPWCSHHVKNCLTAFP